MCGAWFACRLHEHGLRHNSYSGFPLSNGHCTRALRTKFAFCCSARPSIQGCDGRRLSYFSKYMLVCAERFSCGLRFMLGEGVLPPQNQHIAYFFAPLFVDIFTGSSASWLHTVRFVCSHLTSSLQQGYRSSRGSNTQPRRQPPVLCQHMPIVSFPDTSPECFVSMMRF